MTKQQFLADPVKALNQLCLDPREIPSDWMEEAWEITSVWMEIGSRLAREVSKSGELKHSEPFLDLLARSLNCDQVAQLYCQIRELSMRHEDEWRDQFEHLFFACKDQLPFPLGFPEIQSYLNGEELSVGWARDAWRDDHARRFPTDHMIDDVAQGGNFWCRPEWIEQLDHSLDREQLLQLFAEIRDRSGQVEANWRPAFEAAFPDCVSHLPPSLVQSKDELN